MNNNIGKADLKLLKELYPTKYPKLIKKLEKKIIPSDINYEDVKGIRIEARQKLSKFKPYSIGQASRISGVSPSDISVLLVYLEQFRKDFESENK